MPHLARARAVARAAVLAFAGGVVGVASVAVHGLTPGLWLALAATTAAAVALPPGWTWRFPFAAGWVVVVAAATRPRGSGSYLVAGNGSGYALLIGAGALLLFGFATAARRSVRAAEESGIGPSVS